MAAQNVKVSKGFYTTGSRITHIHFIRDMIVLLQKFSLAPFEGKV